MRCAPEWKDNCFWPRDFHRASQIAILHSACRPSPKYEMPRWRAKSDQRSTAFCVPGRLREVIKNYPGISTGAWIHSRAHTAAGKRSRALFAFPIFTGSRRGIERLIGTRVSTRTRIQSQTHTLFRSRPAKSSTDVCTRFFSKNNNSRSASAEMGCKHQECNFL